MLYRPAKCLGQFSPFLLPTSRANAPADAISVALVSAQHGTTTMGPHLSLHFGRRGQSPCYPWHALALYSPWNPF